MIGNQGNSEKLGCHREAMDNTLSDWSKWIQERAPDPSYKHSCSDEEPDNRHTGISWQSKGRRILGEGAHKCRVTLARPKKRSCSSN